MEFAELKTVKREGKGKGVARKLRAAGQIPAVLYGRDIESVELTVDARELMQVIHSDAGTNVLLNLSIEGEKDSNTAMIKEIQRNPLRDGFFHVDFMTISMDREITTSVPVLVVGEPQGVKAGGVLQHGIWEVEVRALPRNLPENIAIDVTELDIGDAVRVSDLAVADDVEVLSPPDEIVVSVVPPTVVKEEVAEEVEGEELAEGEVAAEGEGAAPAEAGTGEETSE